MTELDKILNKSIDELKPVYLITGEESYLLNDFKEKYIKKFIENQAGDFNFTFLEEVENFPAILKNQVNTPPFMADKRYIIARTTEYFTMKHEDDQLLINLFKNFPDTTILIILVDGKIKRNLKVIQELNKIGEIIEIAAPRYAELDKWIINQFAKRGKSVDEQGIRLLEQTFNNNLQMLESEIEKITLFKSDEEKIGLNDIQGIISKDKLIEDTLVFSLTDALVAKKPGLAIVVLNELLLSGAIPLKILGTIVWQIKLFLSVKILKARGKNPLDISRRLKVHQYPVKKCYGKTDNFTVDELEIMLERFLEANHNIVTGKYQPEIALEMAILGK